MKKLQYSLLAVLAGFGLLACDNSIDKTFDDKTVVEFQQAVTLTPAVGRTYPLVSVPLSATVTTAQAAPQVNLVGRQRSSETAVRVSVDKENTTAVEGTHFTLANGGTVTFAPNSSTAAAGVTFTRVAADAGKTLNVVLILEGNGSDISPSENYKKIGYTVRQ